MTTGFALFDTAIGRCGVAWGERGLLGIQLPEADDVRTRSRLLQKAPGAREMTSPAEVQKACDAMAELLDGEARDLSFIALDTERLPAFNRSVYDIARTIAPGETLTYGDIATRLGDKLLSRSVGQALGQNPLPIVIPCHRVLAANGKTAAFRPMAASPPSSECSPSSEPGSPALHPTMRRCCSTPACRLPRDGGGDKIHPCTPDRCCKARRCP